MKLVICVLIFAGNALAQMTQGQCLRLLHDSVVGDESVLGAGVDILLSGLERDRNNLQSFCDAFHDKPDLFVKNIKLLINHRKQRPIWGRPLHNGTIYTVLPAARTVAWRWAPTPEDAVQVASFGDFVDVDNDGDLDYVVSGTTWYALPGETFAAYYRATYINVGNGWTLNACETNISPTNWLMYQPIYGVQCL